MFVGAMLLFVVQPMAGKMILPLLGGTPAVWSTCMVFFQAALLAGYAYAHASIAWLGVRRQAMLHVAVLALPLAVLPLGVNARLMRGGDANPVLGPSVCISSPASGSTLTTHGLTGTGHPRTLALAGSTTCKARLDCDLGPGQL